MPSTAENGRKRVSPGTILGVVAVVLAASGVAHGGIPAADGTITACMGAANRLHLIDKEAGETCSASQTEITLNQPIEGTEIAGPPTGPAGGDLAGAYPDPEIAEGAVTAATLGPTFMLDGEEVIVPDGEVGTAIVDCPGGTRILSGGGFIGFGDVVNISVRINEHHPNIQNRWWFQVKNVSGDDAGIVASALCLE